ncbi:MAG: hypothetical protein M3Z27_01795 [Actinomycetota bacterium]|nr:hypothetical protein [Actinomycetota bacterium]
MSTLKAAFGGIVLLGAVAAVLACWSAAPARANDICAGGSASPFDQYCEPVPTSGGKQTPGFATAALQSVLPARTVHALLERRGLSARARAHLLTLPAPRAPAAHRSAESAPPPAATVGGSASLGSTPLPWLLAIVAAAAVILGGFALWRRTNGEPQA